jgi:transposase
MSDLFWLRDAQMARLEPLFPKSHGKTHGDDRRVLGGIITINCNDLRRCGAATQGPHKRLYTRWKRWSDKGVFARMMAGLAAEHSEKKTRMLKAASLKAHRAATSMCVKQGGRDKGRRGRLIGRTKEGRTT